MPQFRQIVQSAQPVTLVGGGQATRADVHKSLRYAPLCVAADGGAMLAQAAGARIEALIGDFDSVSPEALAQIPPDRQHRITEQESTDFEKALRRIAAPVVSGVGFLGGRLDHQLAVMHSLLALPERACVLLGAEEVVCLAPPRITLPCRAGETVSLFPMAPVRGDSTGLEWPISELAFHPQRRIGTSNRATGPVTLQMETAGMLLILPRRVMPALLAHFATPDAARWPAPA